MREGQQTGRQTLSAEVMSSSDRMAQPGKPPPHVHPPQYCYGGRVGGYGDRAKLVFAGWFVPAGVLLLANAFAASGAEIDLTKLPPPAEKRIDFAADIRPIFERSCLRCHGPERPRSRFRLDNRDAALRGGLNGIDIIPGDSANSPLIHYTARLVKGIEMPPSGRDEPLTPAEVGLLRAWIDQGAAWDESGTAAFQVSLRARAGFTEVDGDERRFREHYRQREGPYGGLDQFALEQLIGPDTRLFAEGHALVDDYNVRWELRRSEVGFVRAGWEQLRSYYDDTGGYFPLFATPSFHLNRDLHLDTGRAWVDFGLTLPRWPRMVLGYELQYRDGEKSTLQWGPVTEGVEGDGVTPRTRRIFPSSKQIEEHTHAIRFDVEHEMAGYRIEDWFRGEFYELETRRRVWGSYTAGDPSSISWLEVRDGTRYFQGANAVRLEKQFREWLLGSAGYLYSSLDADATFAGDLLAAGSGTPLTMFRSQGILLRRESHVGNLNGQLGPWQNLTLSGGAQAERIEQTGVGRSRFDALFLPDPAFVSTRSDLDTRAIEEQAALRYTGVPFTVLFAEGRWRQESRGIFEEQTDGQPFFSDFARDTDASSELRDYRAGFSTSPRRYAALSAHYRRYERENRYDHLGDEPDSPFALAYPAFIRGRDTFTDEIEARLVLRPATWLKATLTYKRIESDYRNATSAATNFLFGVVATGAEMEAAEYGANIYSMNLTLTPWRRIHLNTTASWQDSITTAFANGASGVVSYRGNTLSVLASGTVIVNATTDVTAAYAFSRSDFAQRNFAGGLPVGLQYEQHGVQAGVRRHWSEKVSSTVQYGFFYYDEPSGGRLNNYTAHAVFASVGVRLP